MLPWETACILTMPSSYANKGLGRMTIDRRLEKRSRTLFFLPCWYDTSCIVTMLVIVWSLFCSADMPCRLTFASALEVLVRKNKQCNTGSLRTYEVVPEFSMYKTDRPKTASSLQTVASSLCKVAFFESWREGDCTYFFYEQAVHISEERYFHIKPVQWTVTIVKN